MTQEQWDFVNALIILARFVQVFGFLFAILMLVREFPLAYTFLVFAINLLSFFAIPIGVLVGSLLAGGLGGGYANHRTKLLYF